MAPDKFVLDSSDNNMATPDLGEPVVPFWINDPNVLFKKEYLTEFYPTESMCYEQKLNTITRTVIVLTIVGFAFTKSIRLLLISAITIAAIYLMYYYHQLEKSKSESKKKTVSIKEGFESAGYDFLQKNGIPIPTDVFQQPDSHNPFSNVLMTDYEYNPNKKPAPPAFNVNINDQILAQAKQMVIESNPGQPDIADKLFADLGEKLNFEQSMQPFFSNPGSTIPNDQGAFAEFCYGSMISCKEGNAFACARNINNHHTNY